MGQHKYGVAERAKKRQKTAIMVTIGVVLIGLVFTIALVCMPKQDVSENPEATTGVTEPVVISPEKIGEVDSGMIRMTTPGVKQSDFVVGDMLQYGNAKIVYVASEELSIDDAAKADTHKLIKLTFAFENTGSAELDVSFQDFMGYADGEMIYLNYSAPNYLDADLSSGRYTVGNVYFEVPVDAEAIEIHYQGKKQLDSAPDIKFIYSGVSNCGYVGKAEIQPTENALSVGSVTELNNRKVTYIGCAEYVSEDEEKQPREGYRFVSIEISVENIADSGKEDITAWDFSCYADDMPCRTVHIRDNDIEGLVEVGDIITGTVTFEVPLDAEIIEAEYLYDYKTRVPAVFAIEVN